MTNTGNTATGALSVELTGANAGDFSLSTANISSIANGGSTTFTVVPNTNLTAGTYTAIVMVSGGNGITSQNFDVSFTVNTATYTVTVQNDGNGTASADVVSAVAGTTVTLFYTANSGYQFKEWRVVSGGVTISGDSFTLPAANVTVKAIFELIPATLVAPTITGDTAESKTK